VLSDGTIRKLIHHGRLGIDPLDEDAIQPCSVDLRLADSFREFTQPSLDQIAPIIDPMEPTDMTEVISGGCVLYPGRFVLASTIESVQLPRDLVGQVDGKSSLGRLGLLVHATAGFIDPGFEGQITLELSNVSPFPIRLPVGMRICQVSFTYLDRPAERPYGHPGLNSKYQGQRGATASRYGQQPTDEQIVQLLIGE